MRLVRHSERSEESLFGDNPREIPHSADSAVRNDKARFFGVKDRVSYFLSNFREAELMQ
jgi:hypothetical protein